MTLIALLIGGYLYLCMGFIKNEINRKKMKGFVVDRVMRAFPSA